MNDACQTTHGRVEEKNQVGLATGLAYTQVGGELLSVETVVVPGKGDLTLSEKLGEVMKESACRSIDPGDDEARQIRRCFETLKDTLAID